ncbi:(2Fe-2S) ferredoxin domain-containing protein [Pseudanabaena sp. UWO310]|uniref:(2Fe-2S) ferredoxin domain-containing protein n=1 Tax=Pseudanabaena sp. UWO310 TaxID=2480795 RepID=UPI001156F8E4|nr:(2Fe-2S) ferredoxin domain-containing protein [Pseudanabaena sp. UWO310]TYQ31628.1 (2Fe-2S) ferredoxin domain-containing protein [Pseudanabaena sp. UWO310]
MSKLLTQIADFQVMAQFLGVILKDGYRVKYLRVAIASQEYWVKLPKELSQNFDPHLSVGSWLEIIGTQKIDRKKGILKLEASSYSRAGAPNALVNQAVNVSPNASPNDSPKVVKSKVNKACILICQKSDCWQRGGKEVYQQLEQELRDRGLENHVQIQKTGCQKQCKQAPNLVVMPNKERHSFVKPSQVNGLLNRYLDHN